MKTIIVIISLVMLAAGCQEPVPIHNTDNLRPPSVNSSPSYISERSKMIYEQIIARGIKDEKIISAFHKIERHLFVPDKFRGRAYGDYPLPIGEGQTISQPYIVAFMTHVLNLSSTDKVLEIGTGSGYQAAILGELSNHVFSIEINEPLGRRAGRLLKDLGYHNIKVKVGDGYKGWEEHAPFDAIIVTCAPTHVPEPLKAQLKEGGRMVIPVGKAYDQKLVYLKKQDGKLKQMSEIPVRFVPMVDSSGKTY